MLRIADIAPVDRDDSSLSARPGRRRAKPAQPNSAPNAVEIHPFPSWARLADTDAGSADAAFHAGAGLALLDRILRSGADGAEPDFAGCLRQRLALKAAESCSALSRLREDAAALRDAEHLSGGAAPSPAGRLHRLFRLFAAQPGRLDAATLARAIALLGLSEIDAGALGQVLAGCAAEAPDPLAAAARASAVAMRLCGAEAAIDAEIFALWVADLALASRLGWARPVPLLAAAILHRSLKRGARAKRPRPTDDDWRDAVAFVYGLAVAEAHARGADLARRAQRLATVAPVLRTKGARRVVGMLLDDDGVTPAAAACAGLSDRAARRLFDRLVALGAVRELTGRKAFRIYGL
ncbi:MAG: DUF1403 family protein [Methylocystis sp.]